MKTLVVTYSGHPVKAFDSAREAEEECRRLNDNLSPWEMMAGYFYSIQSVQSQ